MRGTLEQTTLAELAEVNPHVDLAGLRPDTPVSFIPMADVSEGGGWLGRQERRLADVRVGYTPFAEGDVLFAKITPCMENGKGAHAVGLRNRVGFGSTEFHVLRARPPNDSRFIFHWLQTRAARQKAIAYMGGSAGQQRVQAGFFTHFAIPSIGPEDQERIAAVLDTVDALIAKAEAVIARLKLVRAGLLHDLLTRGLDANGSLRPPPDQAPHLYKDSPLGRIPREWDCPTLGECCDWSSGGTPARSQPSWWKGHVPFLTPKDMKVSELGDTIEHLTDEAVQAGSRLMPSETVFIVVRGMVLARTFPVCLCTRTSAFNQDIKAVRGRGPLGDRFLAHWFAATAELFLRKTTEATHGTKKLDTSELLRTRIAVPSVGEQAVIVGRIGVHDAGASAEAAAYTKLVALRSGLMSDLLTGRVRVQAGAADAWGLWVPRCEGEAGGEGA